MNPQLGYLFAKLKGKLKRDRRKESINAWFKKQGVHFKEGGHGWVNINSNIAKNEPHLIYIGDNVTVGGGVEFVTHDNSISKVLPQYTDLFGRIVIGDNCFIGARSVIMYGITLADNVIVASGSVVTKSVKESNVIIGGNPAKIITTWEKFAIKSADNAWNLRETSRRELVTAHENGIRLVER